MIKKTYYTNGKNNFKNGIYDKNEWSAPYMVSYEEIKQRIDGFRLVGRRIKDIRAIGMSYMHRRDDIEGCAYSQLEGLEENERQEKSDYNNIDSDMLMDRYLEIDEPLLIKFDNDEVFEIVTENAPEYRMNMNSIPWWISHKINCPNVEANIMFSVCLGQKIVEVEVITGVVKENESIEYFGAEVGTEIVSEIILWLTNNTGISILPWLDYCEVHCIDRNKSPVKIKVSELKNALFNWEDIHDDEVINFQSQSSTFYFGEKGRERIDSPYYTVIPENEKSRLRIEEDDFSLFTWAISMVNGKSVQIYDDIPDFDYERWYCVLAEAEKIVSFKTFDELFDYLITLKNEMSGDSELLHYINYYGAEFWDHLEKYRIQLEDMKEWTKLVLGKDEKMSVLGF